MANTGVAQVNIQNLNTSITPVSATGNDTATTTFCECGEAILILNCVAVNTAGIMVPVLAGSVDGGTTYVALVPTTGSAMPAISATGLTTYRYKNLPPKVRTQWTKTSGTSVSVDVTLIGLHPVDSTLASAV